MKQWSRVSLINFLFLYSVFIKVFFTFSSVLNWMGHESGVVWFCRWTSWDGKLPAHYRLEVLWWGLRTANAESPVERNDLLCLLDIWGRRWPEKTRERGGEGEIPELFSKREESSPSLWRLMRRSLGCFFVTGGPWRTATQINHDHVSGIVTVLQPGDILQVTVPSHGREGDYAGLGSSNLIVGSDFVKSNEWTRRHLSVSSLHSYRRRNSSLHCCRRGGVVRVMQPGGASWWGRCFLGPAHASIRFGLIFGAQPKLEIQLAHWLASTLYESLSLKH